MKTKWLGLVLSTSTATKLESHKSKGFAPGLLSIYYFPRESWILSEPFWRDERWSARLPLCHSVVGCDWDSAEQVLVLCDTPWMMMQVNWACAWLTHVCCPAKQGQLHWFIYKTLMFSVNPLEISGLSKCGCNIRWRHVELGFGRAAGCWQFPGY